MDEEFSAKDFRTWNATMLAAVVLAADGRAATTKTARMRAINASVREVAEVGEHSGRRPARIYRPARVRPLPGRRDDRAGVADAEGNRSRGGADAPAGRESGAEASVREAVPREQRRVAPSLSNDPDGGRLISVARPTRRTNRGWYSRKVDRADKSGARLLGWASFARSARGGFRRPLLKPKLDARRSAEEASVEERQAEVHRERTETELERRRLENEVSAQARAEQIEDDRRAAEQERAASEQTAHELEVKAREAERHAETIDPEGQTR